MLAGALLAAGCGTGPPTPAEAATTAGRAAESALSAVRTAVLAEQSHADGRLTSPYLGATLSDAQDAVRSARTSLGSLPADGRLRKTLEALLRSAHTDLAGLRDVHRDDSGAILANLSGVADRLAEFAAEHPA